MSEDQSKASHLDEKAARERALNEALKPSFLLIAILSSVLMILLGWYIYILKPAISESNPLDIQLTKSSNTHSKLTSVNHVTNNPDSEQSSDPLVVTSQPDVPTLSDNSSATDLVQKPIKDPGLAQVKKKVASSKRYPCEPVREASKPRKERFKVSIAEIENTPSGFERLKSLFPPAAKTTCTQAQIAMNQCSQN